MRKVSLGAETRSEFPIFANNVLEGRAGEVLPLVYLDSAVSAQKPRAVIDAMTSFLERDYGSVHRGAYGLSVRASLAYEEARERVARFVGPSVSASRIVFTRGTTESLNMLASGLSQTVLDASARIVISVMEHHANMVPWQQAAQRADCELAYIPMVGKAGEALRLDLDKARKLISRDTKVVAFAHVGNVLGQVNPVKEICALAKEVGAIVVLDCAQSMTCFDDDPFAWGVDAVAFSAHKLYGPSGIGVLALSPALMESLPPFLFGGGMISNVTLEGAEWAAGPARFEAGTPPIVEAIGLSAALSWIDGKGRVAIHSHSARLATRFREGLSRLTGVQIFSPETGEETIVSFRHETIHAHDLATLLDGSNVAMRAGHHCAWPLVRFLGVDALLRASFAAYSDDDDVERALEAIKRARLG